MKTKGFEMKKNLEKAIRIYKIFFRKNQLEARNNRRKKVIAYKVTSYSKILDRLLILIDKLARKLYKNVLYVSITRTAFTSTRQLRADVDIVLCKDK